MAKLGVADFAERYVKEDTTLTPSVTQREIVDLYLISSYCRCSGGIFSAQCIIKHLKKQAVKVHVNGKKKDS